MRQPQSMIKFIMQSASKPNLPSSTTHHSSPSPPRKLAAVDQADAATSGPRLRNPYTMLEP